MSMNASRYIYDIVYIIYTRVIVYMYDCMSVCSHDQYTPSWPMYNLP